MNLSTFAQYEALGRDKGRLKAVHIGLAGGSEGKVCRAGSCYDVIPCHWQSQLLLHS